MLTWVSIFNVVIADTNRVWRCPSLPTFFGLTNEYLETVYTKFFQMKMYGNWSFFEVYSLPVQLRNWFYDQLVKTKEEEAKQFKK